MTAAFDHPLSQLELRAMTPEDEAFIYNSWLTSYRGSSSHISYIPPDIYFAAHHKAIERIFQRADTSVVVACLKGDENVILGYLVSEADVIHWVYVKQSFRRMGIARAMLDDALLTSEVWHTHRINDFDWIQNKFTDLVYDPYLL